jgi:hypothetical protein
VKQKSIFLFLIEKNISARCGQTKQTSQKKQKEKKSSQKKFKNKKDGVRFFSFKTFQSLKKK